MTPKVLVIDDSRTIRQMVAEALSESGYEVVEAESGADGLGKLEQHSGIAVVLCDVNMPDMDGLEMLAAVKAKERYASLPIFMLTTEGKSAVVQQAKQLGAKGWIIKPFKPEQLVALVRKIVGV